MVPAGRRTDCDDHDRQPPVRLDIVRPTAAGGHRLEVVGHPVRLHAVHPVPDVGPATRRLAHRSPGATRVHQRGRGVVRPRVGWHGLRDIAPDVVRALLRRGHGRRVRLQRLDRFGTQVVQGSSRPRLRDHGRRVWWRHGALHPRHPVDHRLERISVGLCRDWPLPGPGHPDRGAVPATPAEGDSDRTVPDGRGPRRLSSGDEASPRWRC